MLQPGRKFTSQSSYRYGFNGKEKIDEIKGQGNAIDLGVRIFDPRLGRLFSVDPKTGQFPELTPYQYAANKPIECIDMLGEQNLDYRFSANFSLSYGTGGVSFKVAGAAGVSYTAGAAQITSSSNINIYNGGLGTAGKSHKIQFDVSTSLYLTTGVGSFAASQTKTINSSTQSPISNNYAGSATIGNAFSYSSGLAGDGGSGGNKNLFFDFKAGPLSANYSNDDRLFKDNFIGRTIGGSGNDRSFTTSLTATLNTDALGLGKVVGNITYGTDLFTGKATYKGNPAPQNLSPNGAGGVNSKGNIFYDQTPYQLSLNKSSKFISVGGVKISLDNGGQAQKDQHTGQGTNIFFGTRVGKTDNPIFIYPQQRAVNTQVTIPLIGPKL